MPPISSRREGGQADCLGLFQAAQGTPAPAEAHDHGMSAAFRLDPAREQSISGGEELDEERRQTGGPSIKHRIQARFDVVARRPRPRQPDDPAIRRREQQHFGAIEALPLPAPRRVASVDALRGFTMFWIIGADGAAKALAEMLSGKGTIASTAGNIIGGQFEHAEWEGLRFYDLIFPLFIFVTGVAIVFSLTRLVERRKANPPRIGACCAGRCSCSRWGSSTTAW